MKVRVPGSGWTVIMEVAHGGPSVDPDEQPRVFDELYRGENVGAIEGSGSGLIFVKRIVALH